MEDYEAVEQFGRKSLEVSQGIYGKDAKHPEIAEAIHVLAAGLFKRELGAAEEHVKRSLEMYHSLYRCCPEHPHLVRVQCDLEQWQAELRYGNSSCPRHLEESCESNSGNADVT